jgi:hypothetical protein
MSDIEDLYNNLFPLGVKAELTNPITLNFIQNSLDRLLDRYTNIILGKFKEAVSYVFWYIFVLMAFALYLVVIAIHYFRG